MSKIILLLFGIVCVAVQAAPNAKPCYGGGGSGYYPSQYPYYPQQQAPQPPPPPPPPPPAPAAPAQGPPLTPTEQAYFNYLLAKYYASLPPAPPTAAPPTAAPPTAAPPTAAPVAG